MSRYSLPLSLRTKSPLKVNGSHIVCCLGMLLAMVSRPGLAQSSGRAFGFLNQPSFTGLAGLGGVNLTSTGDPMMFLSNPALSDSLHQKKISLHYLNFPGDIQVATLGYLLPGPIESTISLGLQYFNYGEFEGFDDTGFPLGTFSANEFALTAGLGKSFGVFRYGVNAKLLGSVLESYQAYALAMDFGVTYRHPQQDLVLAVVAKQVGVVLKNYFEDVPLSLPADIRVGASYKATEMPIRFHLSVRNLIGDADAFLAIPQEEQAIGERIFRRVVLGAELLVHESVQLRAGYNHLIRKEFAAIGGQGMGGFSGGLLFSSKKFAFSYSRMFYHVPGGTHLMGISTNLNELRKF
ncbi:type IX secretion system protein PorQ [Lunatibacter salilacus]|uniref:type IX secretion system protein PorQ n=1 Tax=Lunatibacter salilacus TaxID=2483804 RepID=UPI001F2DBAED|nr:type IX secretion system protein PorQ [Lunatibacter salilacus]